MIKFGYTIKLVSDGEIASGFGSGLLDAIAPRNVDGNFIVPASHIKGLMRQSLLDVADVLPDDARIAVEKLFGNSGEGLDVNGLVSMTDAVSACKDAVTVTRTALEHETGVAKVGSLRTTEVVPAGTEFKGTILADVPAQSGFEYLLRFALLAIMELGGSRSRGCGACLVKIDGSDVKPGEMIQMAIKGNYGLPAERGVWAATGNHEKSVFARLVFRTKSPICLPELPVVGNNTIRSGWTIPASAVQGMLLTKINAKNTDVATECFESANFRAWPLLPVPSEKFADCTPVRASASHKISKLADEQGKFTFCDESIEKYNDWKNQPKNAPIKSADGILLHSNENVVLWRSGEMARFLSAHGVINGTREDGTQGRNFFTVESLAEGVFVGYLSMPEDAFDILEKTLAEDDNVWLGKSRSVRGNGKLSVSRVSQFPLSLPTSKDGNEVAAFIVQSPILVPADVDRNTSAAKMLNAVVERAGWGKVTESSASVQVLFGWNRSKSGRENAQLVIAPGSVFVLESAPADWQTRVVEGLGEGRDRGFGAVLPHPGIAKERYSREADVAMFVPSAGDYAKEAWALWAESKKSRLSASQISRLLALTSSNPKSACEFLDRQRTDRGTKFWEQWKPVFGTVTDMVKNNPEKAQKVFKVWYDLTVATTGDK